VEVRCHTCDNVQQLDPGAFGSRNSLEVKCAACGKTFRVINPTVTTLKVDATRKSVPTLTPERAPDGRLLSLPKDKIISLRLLEGGEKGTVYAVAQPRLTIGRTNADITVDDPLVSRLHCALEIMGDSVLLCDLGSTNGTLVNGQPISSSSIGDGSKFEIGSHVFQLLISPKEE
jgi:ribosomal protein S27E